MNKISKKLYKIGYESYRKKFKQEKKIGNIKGGERQNTFNQYVMMRKEGETNKSILRAQTILDNKGKKRIMKDYKTLKIKRGQRVSTGVTYRNWQGESWNETIDLGSHNTLSGLLHDRQALHYIITSRISNGENKEKVLEDYGY